MKEVKVNDSLLKTEKNEYKQKRESFFFPYIFHFYRTQKPNIISTK